MKELKLKYQKGTKTYTQIKSSPKAYIYEVTDTETEHIYYEVFERRYNRYFDCISYPTDKAFGEWAWCVSRGDDHKEAFQVAIKRFKFLSVQKLAA